MIWNIVADSSCDMQPQTLGENVSLSIAPMKLILGDKEYIDDENLDVSAFLRAMKENKAQSSSSCPSPEDFAQEFMKADASVCVCISGALSGTYSSAMSAKKIVEETNPEKKILVIDSLGTSGKMKLIIEEVARLISLGNDFEAVSASIMKYLDTLGLFFTLSCFDNLIKNGRMQKSSALLATIVGIRPVARASAEGKIEVIEKPRGEKAATKCVVKNMLSQKNLNGLKVIISHCNNYEGATAISELLLASCKPKEIEIISTRGLCSYYADQKGLIISF